MVAGVQNEKKDLEKGEGELFKTYNRTVLTMMALLTKCGID